MQLIDTHSHIYYDKYKDDLSEVINRATANNICNIICVGVDIDSSKKSIKISEEYAMIYSTVGYHPHESKDAEKMYLDQLQDLLAHPKVVALGEIGLDYYYNHSDHKTQIRVFREQLELAKTLDIPVIIHNREADNDLYENLKDSGISKGVIHCYSSDIKYAQKIFDLGLIISFTGIITFSDQLQKVVKEIPIENMMLETDSPYLTPIPHRGKRNEPYMVNFIAEKIADIKQMSIDEVASITTKTAKQFFGI
jgi:TatD DNase family protein